jgi:hypothetical protein
MDSTAIFDAVRSVTGAWARQRKAEEREASRVLRRGCPRPLPTDDDPRGGVIRDAAGSPRGK